MRGVPARVSVAAVVGVLVATSMMVGAVAGHLPVRDDNDTRGLLDVHRVTHTSGDRPRWNVITYDGWTKRRLFDVGYVTLLLDTKGNERPDYYVVAGSFGTHLYGHLWRDRASRPDYKIAKVKVWKPAWRKVAIKLPLAKMTIGSRRVFYRWQVETLFIGSRCRQVCFDLAPDDAAVIEPLPAPSQPSPSPSVTATPHPSGTPSPTPSSS